MADAERREGLGIEDEVLAPSSVLKNLGEESACLQRKRIPRCARDNSATGFSAPC